MDSIRIETGEKRVSINDDSSRVIVFNPSDVLFAERFYKLMGEFETKLGEYEERTRELEASQELDENGLPVNAQERLDVLKETCVYVRERIDYLFGEGTAQTAFGDVANLDIFTQFFEGITPFIQNARAGKIAQYTAKKPAIRKRGKK